jgi:hypothetical protein
MIPSGRLICRRVYSSSPPHASHSSPTSLKLESILENVRTLRSSLEEQSKKREAASERTSLDFIPRTDLNMPSLYKSGKRPDYDLICSLLVQHYRKNDFDSAMNVVNRMAKLKITPDSRTLSVIADILFKQDIAIVGPVVLNLLETAIKHKIRVSQRFLDSIAWSSRFAKDPLYPRAVEQLLREWCRLFPDSWTYSESRRTSNSIVSHMGVNELEATYNEYLQAKEKGISANELPLNILTQELLVKSKDVTAVMDIIKYVESSQLTLSTKLYYTLLQSAIDTLDYDSCKFAYLRVRELSNSTIPAGQLRPLIDICASHADQILCERLIKDFAMLGYSSLPVSTAISLVELLTKTEKSSENGLENTLEKIFDGLSTIFDLQPSLNARQLSNSGRELATSYRDEDSLHILINQTIRYCKTHDTTVQFRTFLMNYVLQAVTLSQYPSSAFYTFHRFINKTTSQQEFSPDASTFMLLLSNAYRMGNAKKLSYVIYNQMVEDYKIQPNRGHFELILKTQLVGTDLASILYFLNQMRIHNVVLRNNIHYLIYRNFEAVGDSRFAKLFRGDLHNNLEKYSEFPADVVLRRGNLSGDVPKKYFHKTDLLNCEKYNDGWLNTSRFL